MISPEEAVALAARLLGGLRTKLGEPQLVHARRVAAGVVDTGDDRVVAAALLHDVLKKTDITPDELRAMTGDSGVVDLVEVLTHRPDESYREYLSRCAADPMALLVKRLDLADKLIADDSAVAPTAAGRIRRQARRRLVQLDHLRGLHTNDVLPPAPRQSEVSS